MGDVGTDESSGGIPCWLNLKRWMVSVEEETQSRVDMVLKDML